MSVLISRHGAVQRLTMDRPSHHNALDENLVADIARAVSAADADPSIRALVLTGGERAFCAGADLNLVQQMIRGSHDGPSPFAPAFDALTACRTPVVAAVRGLALGGGTELVLASDTAVAGTRAQFGLPEVQLGLIPGAGGTQRLHLAVGTVRARHLLLTGSVVDAAWAERSGLVAEVVPDEDVLARAHAIADRIAANSPTAVRRASNALSAGLAPGLAVGLAAEAQAFRRALGDPDATEGVTAFSERRAPHFGS